MEDPRDAPTAADWASTKLRGYEHIPDRIAALEKRMLRLSEALLEMASLSEEAFVEVTRQLRELGAEG